MLHAVGPDEPALQADLKTWFKICSRQPKTKSTDIRKAEKTLCRVFDLEQVSGESDYESGECWMVFSL